MAGISAVTWLKWRDLNAEDAEVFAEGLFPGRLEPMIAAVVTVSRPGGRRTEDGESVRQ